MLGLYVTGFLTSKTKFMILVLKSALEEQYISQRC